MEKFFITIDGLRVEAQRGETVLEVARKAGIYIPSLCAHPAIEPHGVCRICIVEIEGVRGTPTSCTTPATPEMVVCTQSETIDRLRAGTLEMLMASHPSPCMVCDSREECESEKKRPTKASAATRCGTCSNRGGCQTRNMALGRFTRTMGLPVTYDPAKLERDDAFMDRDHNACVLCGICFRICEKVHGSRAIAIVNRGKDSQVESEFGTKWSKGDCRFCGACVDECPTGCLTDRWSKWFGEPDTLALGTCEVCPVRCDVEMRINDGRISGTQMVSLDKKLCALGRFVFPRIVNEPKRLLRFTRLDGGEQIPCTRDEALETAASILGGVGQGKVAVVSSNISTTPETRNLFVALAGKNTYFVEKTADVEETLVKRIEAGEIETVIANGDYVTPALAARIPHLICIDFLQVPAVQALAKVVVPVKVLGEKGRKEVRAYGDSICSDTFLRDLKTKLSLPDAVDETPVPQKSKEKFIYNHSKLPRYFFGHALVEVAPDLKLLGFERAAETLVCNCNSEGYEIVEKRLLAPNFHSIKIHAPAMARYAKPGHFAILMAHKHSERSPFTISDWDAEAGWIEFVIEEFGRSSAELGALKQGDRIATASGPLGTPFNFDTVADCKNILLMGGCYGIGAIYPLAREFKKRGVRVTSVIEASSAYLVFGDERLRTVSDEVVIKTRDGTAGTKGGCSDYYAANGAQFDCAVSIGCVFMMRQAQKAATAFAEQKKFVALNPIMVDGTGMCGACRVAVGGKTKFACVDGPFFPLDTVDFDELSKRRSAYTLLEIDAMPRHIGGKCLE